MSSVISRCISTLKEKFFWVLFVFAHLHSNQGLIDVATRASHLCFSVCYQVSLQSLENFLCLFHYVQHHSKHSSKDALRFW